MGPFMVEIVFCRVTRRGRKLKSGMNKAGKANMRNDGPSMSFIPADDTVKVTLDLSEGGPVFSAMDEMMMKMMEDDEKARKEGKKPKGGGGGAAKDSLKRLLKSGIPGVEKMFAGPAGADGKKPAQKGFHKMNDGSKKKFMTAIFGEDGTSVDTNTAAALLVAICAGGDPTVAENIAKLIIPDLGDTVDPTMLAALMVSCSMINAGASTEEVLKAMKAELAASGLSEEEILHKACMLMKAFGKEDPSSMAQYSLSSAQKNAALKTLQISPKDFAQAVMVQKAIAACGATPENFAKIIMIENQLYKRGASTRDIANALKELGDFESKKEAVHSGIIKNLKEEKLMKNDVFMNVRMALAIENENDTNWKEVKAMKDILSGCSPTSPEAISLNLARATKTGGLNKHDIGACLTAQKVMAVLGVDPKILAQITNIEKVIAQNGVPAVEIARVIQDASMPAEVIAALEAVAEPELGKVLNAADVDCFCKFYDNLKLKGNIPEETIDFIDKKLIQVRCSLEDVADNMVGTKLAMGAKEGQVTRDLCETLRKTGASAEITCTTMHGALKKVVNKPDCDIMKDVGRAVVEDGNYPTEDVTKAMTEVCLNILEEKKTNDEYTIEAREEAYKAMEVIMKDAGAFPTEIREYLDGALPPEPERPPSPRLVAELERLRAEDDAREAQKNKKAADGSSSSGEDFVDEGGKPKNKNLAAIVSDSRRGSLVPPGSRRGSRQGSISLGGTERRGSYYGDDVSKRATVAVVVNDPNAKENINRALNGEDGVNGTGKKRKKKKESGDEWSCVAKDDFFKASDDEIAKLERKRAEAERIEAEVEANASASILSKKDRTKTQIESSDTGTDERIGWKEKFDQDVQKDLETERTTKEDKLQNGGSKAWNDPHQFAAMAAAAAGSMEQLEMLSSLLESGLGPDVADANPEEARRALLSKIRSEGMSEDDVTKLMSVFDSQGIMSKIGGVRKYRKISDIENTIKDADAAFGDAIEKAANKKKTPGLSSENRKLMEQILAKSVNDQQEIGSRVAALLAGTSLTTTSGVEIRRREPVEEIGYQTVDGLGQLTRRKVDTYVAPKRYEIPKVTVQDIPRPSIQRQSQSLHRLRKLSEQQREADKKREEEKRITGLRRAKVPLMVYSCGGFTRCFRIARFYDVDGPPIGVTYTEGSRAALNPDIPAVNNIES